MAASDYVPIFFKNRLHLAGRPQMIHALGNWACPGSFHRAVDGTALQGCRPCVRASQFANFCGSVDACRRKTFGDSYVVQAITGENFNRDFGILGGGKTGANFLWDFGTGASFFLGVVTGGPDFLGVSGDS